MQARVKLGLALLAVAFSGSVAAGMPVATESQNVNVGPIDVAKTPGPPAPPVPTPYPNTGHGMGAPDSQKEGSKTPVQGEAVLLKNGSVFKHSTGDEAGSSAGVVAPKPGGPSQGSGAKGVAENGPLKLGVSPSAARQTPKTDFGSVLGQGVPAVAKTPTPGGPVPIPYPNLPVQAPARVTLPTPAPQPAVRAARPILQTQPAFPVRR